MENLNINLLYNICSYLSLTDVYNFFSMNRNLYEMLKELNQLVYQLYKNKVIIPNETNNFPSLKEPTYYYYINNNILIKKDNYLLKDIFPLIIENENINKIYSCVENMKNIAICGGYMTSMYFLSSFHEESDIDIYIWGKEWRKTYDEFFRRLKLYFLIQIEQIGNSVLTISIKNMRQIQLILVDAESLTEILTDFDNMHNRCAYMNKHTYITYDALWSKRNKCTYFYKDVKKSRLEKVKRYSLNVLNNINEDSLINSEIKIEKRRYLGIITPSKNWMLSYVTEKKCYMKKMKTMEQLNYLANLSDLNVNIDYYGDIIFYKNTEKQITDFIYHKQEYFLFYTVKGYLYKSIYEFNYNGGEDKLRERPKYYLYINEKEQISIVEKVIQIIKNIFLSSPVITRYIKEQGLNLIKLDYFSYSIYYNEERNHYRIPIENNNDLNEYEGEFKLALKFENIKLHLSTKSPFHLAYFIF
jgi:hypothetical protein